MRFRFPAPLAPALAVAAFVAFTGCDTNNGSSLNDVAGTYHFTELRFDPSAGALDDADVLTRINEEETELRLFSDGDALFLLEFDDGRSLRADGTVSVSRASARLMAVTESDAQKLAQLLMPATTVLSRNGGDDVLSGSATTTVNLQAYDPENYNGLTAVQGTLYVWLERQ